MTPPYRPHWTYRDKLPELDGKLLRKHSWLDMDDRLIQTDGWKLATKRRQNDDEMIHNLLTAKGYVEVEV